MAHAAYVFGTCLVILIFISSLECKPAANSKNETEANPQVIIMEIEPKDLKYTFADGEEIPAGFKNQEISSDTSEPRLIQEFSPCKDSSGGVCIPIGQCKPNLKPSIQNKNSCDAGEECCLGGPPAETPCKNRGGECVEASLCGNNPAQLKSGTECKHTNGETCCIWLI